MGSYDFKPSLQPLHRPDPPASGDNPSDAGEQQSAHDLSNCVQLAIRVETLQRLIAQNGLLVEDFHCLNQQSKKVVQRALLERLKASLKSQ